jgi:hypothetical protein
VPDVTPFYEKNSPPELRAHDYQLHNMGCRLALRNWSDEVYSIDAKRQHFYRLRGLEYPCTAKGSTPLMS